MEDMTVPVDLTTLITTVGFPITAYLLMYFRFEKKIEELTKAVIELCNGIK